MRIGDVSVGLADSSASMTFRRWAVQLVVLVFLSGCASGVGIAFENSRYDDIALAARYAARCRAHQPRDQVVRLERVHYESGSYDAFIIGRDENAVFQRSCDAEPLSSVVLYPFRELIQQSRGLKGDFFIGQAYSDGTTYFVRSLPNEIDVATYEPNRGRVGAEPQELALLRQWADTADAVFDEGTAN